jgi:hypothetical protein
LTPTVTMPNVIIKQDTVEAYESTAQSFFAQVFGMDYSSVLMTDIAQLSDFSFCGEDQPDVAQYPSLNECYAGWNKWVLAKICEVFRLEPGSFNTRILMTDLMDRIEKRADQRVH